MFPCKRQRRTRKLQSVIIKEYSSQPIPAESSGQRSATMEAFVGRNDVMSDTRGANGREPSLAAPGCKSLANSATAAVGGLVSSVARVKPRAVQTIFQAPPQSPVATRASTFDNSSAEASPTEAANQTQSDWPNRSTE